jgi:hypothetical protein
LAFINVLDNESGGAEWPWDGANYAVTEEFIGRFGVTFGGNKRVADSGCCLVKVEVVAGGEVAREGW